PASARRHRDYDACLSTIIDLFNHYIVIHPRQDLPRLWAIDARWQNMDCALCTLLPTTAASGTRTSRSTGDRFFCLNRCRVRWTIAQRRVLDLEYIILVRDDN